MYFSRCVITGLLLLLIFTPAFSQDCVDYKACGAGLFVRADVLLRAEDVVIAGGIAYTAGGGDGLVTYSLADPEQPVMLAATPTSQFVDKIAVANNTAYLTGEISHGVQIFDVTDPAVPQFLGQWGLSNGIEGIEVSGDYLYAMEMTSTNWRVLRCVDVSDPAAPVATAFVDTVYSTYGTAIKVHDGVLYFSGESGTIIYDISDPAAPVQTGQIAVHGAQDITIFGQTMYIVSASALSIVDISVPTSPHVLPYFTPNSGSIESICVLGDTAYLGTADATMVLIDISIPEDPVQKDTAYTPRLRVPSLASSDHVYMANGLAGFYAFIPSVGAVCLPGSETTVNGDTMGLVKVADYAHVVTSTSVETFLVSDPADPTYASTLSVVGEASDIASDGTYLYVVDAGEGVRIASGAGTASCQWVGLLQYDNPILVEVQGDICWVIDGLRGLCAVDISDPLQAVQISEFALPLHARGLAVEGNLACVGLVGNEPLVIDIADPAAPTLVGSLQGIELSRSLAIRGSMIYVADWYRGLTIFDMQSGPPFQAVGEVWLGEIDRSYSVAVSATTAYLSQYYGDFYVVDIADPTAPSLVKRIDVGSAASEIIVRLDYVYFTTNYNNLHIMPAQCDVSQLPTPVLGSMMLGEERMLYWSVPQVPLYLETCVYRGTAPGFELGEPLACSPDGVYFDSHTGTAVYVIRFRDTEGQFTLTSNEISFNSASAVPELSANWSMAIAPNPFNPTTVITFTTQQDCDLALDIFDLRGRLVGQLFEGFVSAGEKRVLWQGQDQSGQNLPSGTYFVRAISGTDEQTQRVMLLK